MECGLVPVFNPNLHAVFMALTCVCPLQQLAYVTSPAGSVGKCLLQCQTLAGLIIARTKIFIIFSYFLHLFSLTFIFVITCTSLC